MDKKILDVVSLASVGLFFSLAAWIAIWGEGPRGAGNMSVQTKLILLDFVPLMIAAVWLPFRYGKTAVERFPRVFAPWGPAFYFLLIFGGAALVLRWSEVFSLN